MSNQDIRVREEKKPVVGEEHRLDSGTRVTTTSPNTQQSTTARNEFDPTQATFEEFMLSILMNS